MSALCILCNRVLENPDSIMAGFGRTCLNNIRKIQAANDVLQGNTKNEFFDEDSTYVFMKNALKEKINKPNGREDLIKEYDEYFKDKKLNKKISDNFNKLKDFLVLKQQLEKMNPVKTLLPLARETSRASYTEMQELQNRKNLMTDLTIKEFFNKAKKVQDEASSDDVNLFNYVKNSINNVILKFELLDK